MGARGEVPVSKTLCSLFVERTEATPDRPALVARGPCGWTTLSWREYRQRVDGFAKALLSAGVARGDKVALIGANTPRWFVADMAIMTLGGVTVPIYATSSSDQIVYQLRHSEARVFLVDGRSFLERVEPVLREVRTVEPISLLEEHCGEENAPHRSLSSFLAGGEAVSGEELRDVRSAVEPQDPATLIYTSGTTGRPKAVIQTHRNHCAAARNVLDALQTRVPPIDRVSCCYLPLSHVAERVTNLYSPLLDGHCVHFIEDLERFADGLREIRPVAWAGVPRIWEKLHRSVMEYRNQLTGPKRRIFDWALIEGLAYQRRLYEGEPVSPARRVRHSLARRWVIDPLLAALGLDRVEITITGGAPTSSEVLDFFLALGLWLQDVYGQTEGNGTTSIARRDQIRFGSAGKPFPYVQVCIAEDGEILVKSAAVSPGYYKDPELTAETFVGGWLHSGDLGRIDADGFLWVTGRKKDILITSGGKNITPSRIEGELMATPFIEHAVVVGDGRSYLTALLTLDVEQARDLLRKAGIHGGEEGVANSTPRELSELILHPMLRERIHAHVERVNKALSRPEQIKSFQLLPAQFSTDGGELTPTLKVRRGAVLEKYSDIVEQLYAEPDAASTRPGFIASKGQACQRQSSDTRFTTT